MRGSCDNVAKIRNKHRAVLPKPPTIPFSKLTVLYCISVIALKSKSYRIEK